MAIDKRLRDHGLNSERVLWPTKPPGGTARRAFREQHATTPNAPSAPASLASDRSDGGYALAVWIASGFGLLVAGLLGGFLWYRRRLP